MAHFLLPNYIAVVNLIAKYISRPSSEDESDTLTYFVVKKKPSKETLTNRYAVGNIPDSQPQRA